MTAWSFFAIATVLISAETEGKFDVTVQRSGAELVIDNPWPEVTPTVYIVGLPDREKTPVRKTKGVTLNGLRLSETCLSESVLILYPGGTGKWGYNTGFDIFRMPDKVPPRQLVEYDKWQYDPVQRVRVSGSDMNLLMLGNNKRSSPLVYELAFPEGVKIERVTVRSNVSGFAKGDKLLIDAFADRDCKERLAAHEVVYEQRPWLPVTLAGLDRSRVLLRIASAGPGPHSVNLYYTKLEADLDTSGLDLPVLKQGTNTWAFTDDDGSSHRARIVLRWHRKPEADRIWDDFEGPQTPFGNTALVGPRDGKVGAFTGNQFGRIEYVPGGKDVQAYRGFGKPVDLSEFNRMSIAVRTPVRRGMCRVLFGIRNEDTGNQYVNLRPGQHWQLLDFDISQFQRDRVKAMTIYFLQHLTRGRSAPEIVLDVDTLCFYHAEPEPKTALAPLPDHVLNYKSPHTGKTAPERPIPPVREWFPMGFYSGYPDRQVWPYWLDDMVRHHMNTIYVSNGSLENLEAILPMAEARGIRLVHQGTSPGSLYYLHYENTQTERNMYEKGIVPRAREWIPKFRGRWGLVAWSLTEEIPPNVAQSLGDYYRLVRQLDPTHPPTVLHNNHEAAELDLKQNKPPVVTHDFYPFFWCPSSGPSNPPRSLSAYRSHVARYYKLCRQHGASLWMMPQSYSVHGEPSLNPPHYGYRTGMRTPEPGEVKLQGWVAIAEGATGLMYYHYKSGSPHGKGFRTHDWQPTPQLKAAGELFERVTRVAPLLCRLERDYNEENFVRVAAGEALAHSFIRRKDYPGQARYVVIASLDGFASQTIHVTFRTKDTVHDLLTGRCLPGGTLAFDLGPGEGTVLLVGSDDDIDTDRKLIECEPAMAEQFNLRLRYQKQTGGEPNSFQRLVREENWDASETAVIVCDVWDLHHCLNAVRRLEQFGPRLNEVLIEARRRGAVIIHSPSDCMQAYRDHPARHRAKAAPRAETLPEDIECWCSRIPAEERADYPIDQSDGGEDDDPKEHSAWAAKLKAMGRNPGMPWKTQSSMISIDAERDYISDRGDEVWNILEHREIRNVILTGVHTNMCVLGRPFGLRQMSRNGKNVVLMRDMTDTMYNPQRWPYVDHFTANDLIVSHIERHVCATIASDQVIGGKPLRFRNDNRKRRDIVALATLPKRDGDLLANTWSPVTIPGPLDSVAQQAIRQSKGIAWYRCAVRIRKSWMASGPLRLQVPTQASQVTAWCNGHPLKSGAGDVRETSVFPIAPSAVRPDDVNLIVLRVEQGSGPPFTAAPTVVAGDQAVTLEGRWQLRAADNPILKNMPLPARFGASPDILFE